MSIDRMRVLLTGAAGGIGSATAMLLAERGARILLADLDRNSLQNVADAIAANAGVAETHVVDLTDSRQLDDLARQAETWQGGINVLINGAGVNYFGFLEEQTDADILRSLRINCEAPILLTRRLLASLRRSKDAHVINVGSTFGSIGFPGFAAYSASKFALRGFTEAMRREMANTSVEFHYLAPRATRTRINSPAVCAMNEELHVKMDAPDIAARAIVRMLEKGTRERYLGWPEKLFVRVNGLIPGLVDSSLKKQLPIVEHYAKPGAPEMRPARKTSPAKL